MISIDTTNLNKMSLVGQIVTREKRIRELENAIKAFLYSEKPLPANWITQPHVDKLKKILEKTDD